MWLSEQCYVGLDNKTKTLACKYCTARDAAVRWTAGSARSAAAAVGQVCESSGELLRGVSHKVEEYVQCIGFVILKFGTARATSVCPAYESMRLQCLRANAVLGYLQDGCKE